MIHLREALPPPPLPTSSLIVRRIFFAASVRTGQNLCAPSLHNTLFGEKVSSYVFCPPPPLHSAKGTGQSRALQPTLAHET